MTIRADSSQYYAVKAVFEEVFGNEAWLDLKECTSLAIWKRYTSKLFRAIQLSIEETIEVRDDAWSREICEHISHGQQIAKTAISIDELLSCLSATLIRLVFLQVGMLPNRRQTPKMTLARQNWNLGKFRTVQYIQTSKHLEALFWRKQQGAMDVERQLELFHEYQASKSTAQYSVWCTNRDT